MSNEKNETGIFRPMRITGVMERVRYNGEWSILLEDSLLNSETWIRANEAPAKWAGRHIGWHVNLTLGLKKPEFGGTEDE